MPARLSNGLRALAFAGAALISGSGCVCLASAPEAAEACQELMDWSALFGSHDEDLSNQGGGTPGGGGDEGGGDTGPTPD
jgi:hypothetical protein